MKSGILWVYCWGPGPDRFWAWSAQ